MMNIENINMWLTIISIIVTIVSIVCAIISIRQARKAKKYKEQVYDVLNTVDIIEVTKNFENVASDSPKKINTDLLKRYVKKYEKYIINEDVKALLKEKDLM